MSDTRGIFRLRQIYELQQSGLLLLDKYFYGYIGGGAGSGPVYSTVNRIDYINDTVTPLIRGSLGISRSSLSATGNTFYGWFIGGSTDLSPSRFSTIERIDYSNDLTTASTRRPLLLPKYLTSSTGNTSYGWVTGGLTPGIPTEYSLTYLERIDYANDTTSIIQLGSLTFGRFRHAATGNSSYGWIGGGQSSPSSPVLSSIERINYSNDDTTALRVGSFTLSRYQMGATGNSSYAWFAGGSSGPVPTTYYSTVDRVTYANDTVTASPRGSLSVSKDSFSATGNSYYGWCFGGTTTGNVLLSSIDRIDYANDTVTSSPRGLLSTSNRYSGASSASSNGFLDKPVISGTYFTYGHFGGGVQPGSPSPTVYSSIERIDYSNDTNTASLRGLLTISRYLLSATGNSSYGWFGGGYTLFPAPTVYSRIERIDYANDVLTATTRATLDSNLSSLGATGNLDYGWFGGGASTAAPQTIVSSVYRVDYTNDTSTASPRGVLSIGRYFLHGATGNSSYGWFGAGLSAPTTTISTIDRIDYANDTATALVRGSFSVARGLAGATGNSSYGWFGGGVEGSTYYSLVDRVEYINDTVTASPRGTLTVGRSGPGATGNSSYGWFAGGFTNAPSPNAQSTVNRLDYSNDTAITTTRGSLSSGKQYLAATSPSANTIQTLSTVEIELPNIPQQVRPYGYFANFVAPSLTPSIISSVERIDYTNDTATASPRGPLSIARAAGGGTGNGSYGWYGGGVTPSPLSTVDRIDYANDTATASPRGSLTFSAQNAPALGTSFYGWFTNTTLGSELCRIDYANDLSTASPRGRLAQNVSSRQSMGNSSYGWFSGGSLNSVTTLVSSFNRIDYSNDLLIALVRGKMSLSRQIFGNSGTGNSSYGWFGGGQSPTPFPVTLYSTIDRIDYSNDTATSSPRGPLTVAKQSIVSTGNRNFGYFSGGNSYTSPADNTNPALIYSTIERIDYSNDTITASPKGFSTLSRTNGAGVSPTMNALPQ